MTQILSEIFEVKPETFIISASKSFNENIATLRDLIAFHSRVEQIEKKIQILL